jgi:hypothetical protein
MQYINGHSAIKTFFKLNVSPHYNLLAHLYFSIHSKMNIVQYIQPNIYVTNIIYLAHGFV